MKFDSILKKSKILYIDWEKNLNRRTKTVAKFLLKNTPAMKVIKKTLKETPEGYLFFEYDGEWKKLFFKNGKITGASSSNRADYLIQYLIFYEGINTDQLEEMYQTGSSRKKSIEEVLGAASPETLKQLIFEKIADTVFIAANWPECTYSIVRENQLKNKNVNVEVSPDDLVKALKKRITEFHEIISFMPLLGSHPKVNFNKTDVAKLTNQEEIVLNYISAGKSIPDILSIMAPHNYLLFKCLLGLCRRGILIKGTGAPMLVEDIVSSLTSDKCKKCPQFIVADLSSEQSAKEKIQTKPETKYMEAVSIFQKLHYNDPDDLIYSHCFIKARSCFIIQFYNSKVSPYAVIEIVDSIEKIDDANEIDIEIYQILKKNDNRLSLKELIKKVRNRHEIDILISVEKLMLNDTIKEIEPETFLDAVKLGKKDQFGKLLKKNEINRFFTSDVSTDLTPLMLSAVSNINCENVSETEKPVLHEYEMTFLMFASMVGNYEAVDFLLQNNANPNLHNGNGVTALMLALKNGYDGIAMLLMKHGAGVNAKNRNNYSALMIAASKGMTQIVDFMIKFKVDVDHLNSKGQTALHIAIIFNHKDIAVSLIAAGADLDIADKDGHAPIYYAESVEMTELIEKGLLNSKRIKRKLNKKQKDLKNPEKNLLKDEKEVIPGSFPVFIFSFLFIATSYINIHLFFFSEDRYGMSSEAENVMEQLGMEYCERFKLCRDNLPQHVIDNCHQMGIDLISEYFRYAKKCDKKLVEECRLCIKTIKCADFYEINGTNLSEYCYQCISVCKYTN